MILLGPHLATAHARALLSALGVDAAPVVQSDHPALAWRRAGFGDPMPRVALTAAADGALAALETLAAIDLPFRGAVLLGERMRLLALPVPGRISANGRCRLIATADGMVALNLPRADDWELLPALFGADAADWAAVEQCARQMPSAALIAQARLLGLAIADAAGEAAAVPFRIRRFATAPNRARPPLVVDLSGLWAGPLAGMLLGTLGARVVKVESRARPDGARGGHTGFFDRLNAGKASVMLDFADAGDRARLAQLIDAADIVIEASRPRALAQLGIDAEAVAARGAVWLSITAHGRAVPAGDWIGYGDDAAIAGGLAAAMATPCFAGDAIADPLTGITAALAAWAAWLAGGGQLISIALAEVIAHALATTDPGGETADWAALAAADTAPLYPLRDAASPAAALGADTDAVFAALSAR